MWEVTNSLIHTLQTNWGQHQRVEVSTPNKQGNTQTYALVFLFSASLENIKTVTNIVQLAAFLRYGKIANISSNSCLFTSLEETLRVLKIKKS